MSFIKPTFIFGLFSFLLCSCGWRKVSKKWFSAIPQNEITPYYTGVCQDSGFQIYTSAMADFIQMQMKNKKKNMPKHVVEEQKIRELTI